MKPWNFLSMNSVCKNLKKPRMLDLMILSPEVVAMIPGPETPQLDPRASKSPSPFSYGLQKTHPSSWGEDGTVRRRDGWRHPRPSPYLSHSPIMNLSCSHQCSNCWLRPTKSKRLHFFQIVSLVAKAVPGREPIQISLEKRGITGLYNWGRQGVNGRY